MSRLRPFISLCILLMLAVPRPAGAQDRSTRNLPTRDLPAPDRYIVPRLTGPVILDGPSDEPAWQAVEPLPLVTQSPYFGNPPTEPTEIRIAYDDDHLYLAGRLFDQPEDIRGPSLKRDELNPYNDYFGILLDAFNDNENALAFFTTPAGIRLDFTVADDARTAVPGELPLNLSWDTFWDTAVVTTDEGWFAELRIPLSSLRFSPTGDEVVMGILVWRYLASISEVDIFPAVDLSRGEWSAFTPSQGRDCVFNGIRSRRPLYLTPYLLGGGGFAHELNDPETVWLCDRNRTRETGLDLKYSLTSNLTLDVTVNTDFAQVEADDQQVNLTRFSLFFPEKRRFFQERAGIFNVNLGGQQSVFYSRRIGLYEGEQIPILGGVRLVGRLGRWDVGALSMQTGRSSELPSENFGVIRLRRQVFNPNSYLGGIATSRIGTDGSEYYTWALDGIIRVVGDEYLTLNWARTSADTIAYAPTDLEPVRFQLQWERRRQEGLFYSASAARSGSAFDPASGFMLLTDYRVVRGNLGYGRVAADESSYLARSTLSLSGTIMTTDSDAAPLSEEYTLLWSGLTRGLHGFTLALRSNTENLDEDFELSDEVAVPPGRYTFSGAEAAYSSPPGRSLNYYLTLSGGQYYHGRQRGISVISIWSLSEQVNLQGYYQLNRVVFPGSGERFIAHIARLRLQLTFTTQLSLISFVQYNSAADVAIANLRFRYNPREGNDFYMVYNEGINTDRLNAIPHRPFTGDRTIMLKYAHTFIF